MSVSEVGEPPGTDDLPRGRYLDREESWLRFNQRVLELAEDESVPLLERVRFLAIFAGNLDEFFMVRVAGLMRLMAAGLPVEGVSVQLPGQVLNRTLDLAGRLTARHAACFTDRILPTLSGEGIEILRWKELSSLIDLAMDEATASWWLGDDETWTRRRLDNSGKPLLDIQSHLISVRRRRSGRGSRRRGRSVAGSA